MFLRPKRPLLADKARRPRPPGAKRAILSKRMFALEEAEQARQVFVQCSGMHTPYVQWIIHQLCFRTWWVTNWVSCADCVMPALTQGIPQAWENLVAAQAEIAVYAALFMSIYVGMFLGGYAPPNAYQDATGDRGHRRV